MKRQYVVPIENSGTKRIDIEIEPEGDWFTLSSGERCELRLAVADTEKLDLELEFRDDLVFIHCSATKEVWKDGQRQR